MDTELQDSCSQTGAVLTLPPPPTPSDYVLLWHLGYHNGWGAGILLVSNMYRPGILLNILWCTRWTPTTKNYPSENVRNAKIEKLYYKQYSITNIRYIYIQLVYVLIYINLLYIEINIYICIYIHRLHSWLRGKEPTCQWRRFRRLGFDSRVRKILWRRKWQPTPVFLPGKSHGQRSLVGYSPWGCKE